MKIVCKDCGEPIFGRVKHIPGVDCEQPEQATTTEKDIVDNHTTTDWEDEFDMKMRDKVRHVVRGWVLGYTTDLHEEIKRYIAKEKEKSYNQGYKDACDHLAYANEKLTEK